jgi:hypothetical protein
MWSNSTSPALVERPKFASPHNTILEMMIDKTLACESEYYTIKGFTSPHVIELQEPNKETNPMRERKLFLLKYHYFVSQPHPSSAES